MCDELIIPRDYHAFYESLVTGSAEDVETNTQEQPATCEKRSKQRSKRTSDFITPISSGNSRQQSRRTAKTKSKTDRETLTNSFTKRTSRQQDQNETPKNTTIGSKNGGCKLFSFHIKQNDMTCIYLFDFILLDNCLFMST
jgi:hypothetical protein